MPKCDGHDDMVKKVDSNHATVCSKVTTSISASEMKIWTTIGIIVLVLSITVGGSFKILWDTMDRVTTNVDIMINRQQKVAIELVELQKDYQLWKLSAPPAHSHSDEGFVIKKGNK